MTDPLSAYIDRVMLVDSDGAQSEGVNKVAMYFWDTQNLVWTKATTGGAVGTNVNVLNFPASYSVLQGTVPWADNISQWGGAATTLGQKAMAESVPITLASDQSNVLVSPAANGDVVDTVNSTTATLGSNANFTGASWVNCLNYAQIQVLAISDKSSATLGLEIQFSTDGVNIDHIHPYSITGTATIDGNVVQVHTHAKFYRVSYTNGAVAQGVFRLQSILRPIAASGSVIEAETKVDKVDDCVLTKSIITGFAVDGSGYVDVLTTTDGGIVINQNTVVDVASSSTTNLASGASLVGPAVSDLNYTAVQFIFNADQDCMIFVDQSPDGTNWDIVDSFQFRTPNGAGNTVQLVASYYRVRVTNTSPSITTYFRLQVLKIPFLPSLPRSLDADGHLQTVSHGFADYRGVDQYLAPNGEVVSLPLYKLVGDSFSISSLDPNLWTGSAGTGGTVDISGGQLRLITGTTANNATSLTSVRTARFTGLAPNKIRVVVQLPDTGTANNTRRWGVGSGNDRAYFELNGTTFSVVTRKGGVDSVVNSGSFNGQWGRTFTPGTISHFYEIVYQPRQVVWLADNKIIHTLSASAATWTETLHLPVYIENFNTAGSTTSVSLFGRLATIARFGIPETQPIKKYIHGAFSGNLKIGPGNLHGVAINSNTGTTITLYDSLTAAGDVIALIQPNQIVTLDYKMLTFSIGLTAVTVGGTIDCTIMYE